MAIAGGILLVPYEALQAKVEGDGQDKSSKSSKHLEPS